ncbi:hypothetical protein NQZ68_011006 [Dissostichus eleginoides]|nr:hypothetical protein NQZ68_011006 [Dissostichus eleginoides]
MEKVNSDEALASPRAVCRPTTDRKKNNESEAMIRETVWSRRLQGHDRFPRVPSFLLQSWFVIVCISGRSVILIFMLTATPGRILLWGSLGFVH